MTEQSPTLAQIMMDRVAAMEQQRDDILEAFVAKYGFGPEEAVQIEQKTEKGTMFHVVKIHPDHAQEVEYAVLRDRFGKQPLTMWQKFCLWLATGKTE